MALRQMVATYHFDAAASVTRNPAIPRVMRECFHGVMPDLTAEDPLRHMRDPLFGHLATIYARHIGSDPHDAPFVPGRYTGGLYGADDPGQGMARLPGMAENPENGIMMLAADRVAAL